MKKLIDYLLSIAWIFGAICLITIFICFIWAMIRAVIEIIKEDREHERERISATNQKDQR